jgi:TolB-like protein/class 3 adenylate cyclase/Tfp pilus assembly protein PilF
MVRDQRRLAAIVSADVAGYSRLMGRDESGTLAALKAVRREVVDPRVAAYGGRIVKTTGDGLLLEFPSVVDAVRCVVEVQTVMGTRGANLPDDRRIAFRIGVNLGDIIVDDDDIFGDGVNIAARLQEIAAPGGACVASRVHDDVLDRLDTTFEDGGVQTLKNIARPVQVWRWSPGTQAPTAQAIGATADVPLALPDKPSIAVLPFQNLSGDPEQDYFVDGFVEDIITALSRFKSLFVIARNSSFTYKGKSVDIKQVGRELGVRYVLEGSVRKAGGRVRITGQLIDSATGVHLWADRFDSSLEDVFELQDKMATNVVGAVAPKLDEAEIERAKHKPVENLDAYDCLLRGMAHSYVKTKEAQEAALRLFYRAIELDPDYATPYGLAARIYSTRAGSDRMADKDWEGAEVRRLAVQVSAIGRDDALALCWAGFSLVRVCREYDTGAALVDQALSVNQNLAIGWQSRGWVSLFLGQHEAAIEQLTHALRLSPLDPESFQSEAAMAFSHLFQGRYREALQWTGRSHAHQANWPVAMRAAAVANALAGNLDEARKIVAHLRQIDPQTCILHLKEFLPYSRPEDMERMIEGLRLAGLPE